MAADPWAEFKPVEQADPWAEFAAPPALGRGDLQLAERKREVIAKAENVPAHLLTGTPIDQQRAEALWNGGVQSRPLTGRQAAQGMAMVAAPLVGPLFAGPAGGAAAGGGLMALGTTEAQDASGVVKDVAAGTAGGLVADKALRTVAAPVVKYAGKKLGQAVARATAEKAAERAAALRSASGTLGNARAENNRVVEAIRELLSNPALSEADKFSLQRLQSTPEYAQALASLTKSLEERLPQVAGRVATGTQAVESANALPSVEKMVEERLSPGMAGTKIMDRVRRYWLPVLGGTVGALTGGAPGAGIGALAGRGASPTVQALWRMTKDPAVQTQIWTPVERLAAAMARRPTAAAASAGPAAGDPIAEMLLRAMGTPRLVSAAAEGDAP